MDQYLLARDALIGKDLIDFDGTIFQVLDLPPAAPAPFSNNTPPSSPIKRLIKGAVKEVPI
jgi:hypothetical protein